MPAGSQPKLLDRLRLALRARHYSRSTEKTYVMWVRRFIFFHELRHPEQVGEPEINSFLTHLAVKEQVSASTQNQALSALLFLYRQVVGREIADLGHVIRARRPWKNAKTGEEGRHHLDESILQKAVKRAVEKAGLGETGNLSFAETFVRHALARAGIRHPHRARTARA